MKIKFEEVSSLTMRPILWPDACMTNYMYSYLNETCSATHLIRNTGRIIGMMIGRSSWHNATRVHQAS